MHINEERALRAEMALAHYDELEPIDLLTDLMHWCHLNQISFRNALDSARINFDCEIDPDDIEVGYRFRRVVGDERKKIAQNTDA